MINANWHKFARIGLCSLLLFGLNAHRGLAASPFADLVTWENPTGFSSAEELIISILRALTVIAIPLIVLMIIYGGFLYSTARGNAEQLRKATMTLTFAIIGGILVIGAVAITEIVGDTVQEFRE
jgi:hypothetical protein